MAARRGLGVTSMVTQRREINTDRCSLERNLIKAMKVVITRANTALHPAVNELTM